MADVECFECNNTINEDNVGYCENCYTMLKMELQLKDKQIKDLNKELETLNKKDKK